MRRWPDACGTASPASPARGVTGGVTRVLRGCNEGVTRVFHSRALEPVEHGADERPRAGFAFRSITAVDVRRCDVRCQYDLVLRPPLSCR
eukprot:4082514-Pyramimonas_sp.AAC.2